jgi:P-type Cu+ transporter
VIACPCGVGLAAPTAFTVASGLAAKSGILVRGGGEAFEEAAKVDIVCFDKTGTLTEGAELRVQEDFFIPDGASSYQDTLCMLKAVESASSHPLAHALVKHCDDQQISSAESTQFLEIPGRGAKANFNSRQLLVGSEKYLIENGAELQTTVATRIDGWRNNGYSVVLVGLRTVAENSYSEKIVLIAGFAISDALRQEAFTTIKHLQDLGIATWMISGDNEITCKAVARRAGIPENNVIAGVLPHEKVIPLPKFLLLLPILTICKAERIKWLQQSCQPKNGGYKGVLAKVAMCGDGINDGPVSK